jgi:hypothetical protein
MTALPIIRLEVDRMKYAITACLTEHAAQMDKDLRETVEKFFLTNQPAIIIRETAIATIKKVMEEEVKHFFLYGDGRRALKKAIQEEMEKDGWGT